MQIKQVEVTPAIAREWLKKNTQNRPLRKIYISKMAEAMKRGEWKTTHQAIAMADGRLLDGQHRLLAFLESGLPKIEMTVAYNSDPATFDVIDVGANRSAGDIFREDRMVINPIAFIGRLVYSRYTMHQLQPIYIKFHKQFREIAGLLHRNTKGGFTSAPIKVAMVAAILDGESKDYVYQIYKDMGNFNVKNLPKVALLFVRQLSTESGGKKVSAGERDQILARAFTVFHKASANFEKLSVKDLSTRMSTIRGIFKTELGIK